MAKTLPAVKKPGSLVSWNDAVKTAAAKQVKAAAVLTTGSAMISFKGAVLSIGGVQQRNNAATGIVLATMHERAFYEGKYNPEEPRTPVCYAYGEVDEGLPIAPREECAKPQSELCKGCEHAEWGTAEIGRGQACRQHVKFAWISAAHGMGPSDIENAEIYFGRVPPTSLKAMKVYLDFLAIKEQSSFAMLTKMEVQASSKSIFTVHLEPGIEVPKGWQSAILGRLEEARRRIEEPYPVFDEEKPAPAKQPGKKRF